MMAGSPPPSAPASPPRSPPRRNQRAHGKAAGGGGALLARIKREEHENIAKERRAHERAHDILEEAVSRASRDEMARSALEAWRIGRRNSMAQATAYLMALNAGDAGEHAAAGTLAARAARRIQRACRAWLGNLRRLELRLKLFSLDFKRKSDRPLQWKKPERARASAAADEAADERSAHPFDSDEDNDDDPPKALSPKPVRKKKKPKPAPYFPVLKQPRPPRRSNRKPTAAELAAGDPLPWAVPVDTSNTAILSRPLPKKPPSALVAAVAPIKRRRPPRDAVEEMERTCAANSELLKQTLEQQLYDERYRSVIDAGEDTSETTLKINRIARHLGRVSYERVKFDCQCAMVIQLRDHGFLR